jgi:hypothetical protein
MKPIDALLGFLTRHICSILASSLMVNGSCSTKLALEVYRRDQLVMDVSTHPNLIIPLTILIDGLSRLSLPVPMYQISAD